METPPTYGWMYGSVGGWVDGWVDRLGHVMSGGVYSIVQLFDFLAIDVLCKSDTRQCTKLVIVLGSASTEISM